jgi:hypothetical protein
MSMNRKVYTAGAGLMAACLAAATASAQTFMTFQYGASAGAVSQVSVANLAPNWVATGVRNSAGNLELITWQSNGTALIRGGSATAGAIGNAGMATIAMSPTSVVTGAVNANGIMEITFWYVSPFSGAVKLIESSIFGISAQGVRLTKLDSSRFLAATEDANGDLTLSLWAVDDTVGLYGYISGVTGSAASIAAVSTSQAVTAFRNSAGDLELDSWSVTSANTIVHQATITAGAVSDLDITAWADAGHVATPVVNSSGKLEVIDWIVNPTTGAITRESSATVGPASQVAASTIGTLVFTAVDDSGGKVDAGVWGYNGAQIGQGASAQQEAITAVSAAPLSTGPYSVTATRTKAGDLQVDVWNYFSIQ